jgi:nicotinate-nucleotide adenylyltransferase
MLAASIPPAMPITIDDCEINREGVSYTIDTVKDIIKRYGPDGKLGLILGNDLKQDFHLWKNAEEIQSLCDILWKDRLGDISSTLVRKKIENNEEWRYLVPNGARYIIEDRNLYTSSLRASAPPREIFQLINRIETEVRALVNTTRYIHSRSVAITATALARHFGLDPSRAYLAGIAHDIAKQIEPGPMTHGKAGAQLLKDRFGFGKNEKDILEAVEKHTTGAPGMCDLAKIIYISDKIEPARRKVRPEYRNLGLWPTIDSLLACVIEDVFEILKEKGKIPSPDTIKLLEGLQ